MMHTIKRENGSLNRECNIESCLVNVYDVIERSPYSFYVN